MQYFLCVVNGLSFCTFWMYTVIFCSNQDEDWKLIHNTYTQVSIDTTRTFTVTSLIQSVFKQEKKKMLNTKMN